MHLPELGGTLLALSLLTADAVGAPAAGALPIVPIPEPHSTGNPWADVALFGMRVVGILAAVSIPTILGKWIEHRHEQTKERRAAQKADRT